MSSEANKDHGFEGFKEAAAEAQQSLFRNFRHPRPEFDAISKKDEDHIRTKISWYAFCKDFMKLTENEERKEMTAVNKVMNRLKAFSGNGENLIFGCIYVYICLKKDKSVLSIPVFKIKRREDDERTIFYEMFSDRFYMEGWEEYIRENKLPKCLMAYLPKGKYESRADDVGKVHLDFRKSPSWTNLLPTVDALFTVGGGLAVGVMAVSLLFPPALVVEVGVWTVFMAFSAYGSCRSAQELIDRYRHGQSCKLTDQDALFQWLNLGLSVGSAVSSGLNTAVRVGVTAKSGCIFTNRFMRIIKALSLGVNMSGVCLTLVLLVAKFLKDGLDRSDFRTFASLIFFFTSIVVTVRQSKRILEIFSEQPYRIADLFGVQSMGTGLYSLIMYVQCNLPFSKILKFIGSKFVMAVLRGEHELLQKIEGILDFVHLVISKCRENLPEDMGILKDANALLENIIELVRRQMVSYEEMRMEHENDAIARQPPTAHSLIGFLDPNVLTSFLTSHTMVLEIMDGVQNFVQELGFSSPDIIEGAKSRTIRLINRFAMVKLRCKTDAEYLDVSEFICKQLERRCTRQHVLEEDEMTEERRIEILNGAFSNFDENVVMEKFQEQKNENKKEIADDAFFSRKPLYQTADNSVYYFEVQGNAFDDLIDRIIREHFKDENKNPTSRRIIRELEESRIWVYNEEKAVMIIYKYVKDEEVAGLVFKKIKI